MNSSRLDDKLLEGISNVTLNTKAKHILTDWVLGYAGNTSVSLLCVAAIEKFASKQKEAVVRWQTEKYEQKWEKERKGEYEALATEEAKAEWKSALHANARERAEKHVKAMMLTSGGFAMIPVQAFADVTISDAEDKNRRQQRFFQLSNNAERFTSLDLGEIQKTDYDLKPEDWPVISWNQARKRYAEASNFTDRLKTGKDLFLESTISYSMRTESLKWGAARFVALAAAFKFENFIQENYVEERDAVSAFIARALTVATGMARGKEKGYIDPGLHKQIDLALTDAYMSTAAILTTRTFNNTWDTLRKGSELVHALHNTGVAVQDTNGNSLLEELAKLARAEVTKANVPN